jgi:hypothetical protein
MMRVILRIIILLMTAVVLTFGHSGGARLPYAEGDEVKAEAHAVTARDSSENLAAAFGWLAAVDTDLRFSEFFRGNYTIAARFMLQYERSYQAPILTVNGKGNFLIAVAGYGEGRTAAEKLMVSIGQTTRYYTVAGRLSIERWHWLALACEGTRLRLYLDGAEIRPDDSNTDFPVTPGETDGTLRLGRRTSGDEQFYGLIDDLAVFDSALSEKALKSYYRESPRLSGTERDIIAAYTFDRASNNQPAAEASARPVSFTKTASQVTVSATRDSKQDVSSLPLPFNGTEVHLPFAPNQSWKVIQGYGQSLSHNGGGCFSLDFARADSDPQEQPVYACAAGRVIAMSDNNDPEPFDSISKDNFNYMQMEIVPGEIITYLHMKNGSLTEAMKRFAQAPFPKFFTPFSLPAGAQVGKVGNTWLKEQPQNWHLHFAAVPFANSPISIPLAFSDYEVYEPQTRSWRKVERGVPQQNQLVRRVS